MLTWLGLASFACGTSIGVKLDIVGDLYLLEVLLVLLVVQCILSRGLGRGFVPSVFLGFFAAGVVTFFGYLLSDLIAANEPWQYLKGWGRVALLIIDTAALMLLAAHGRQNLWWLAVGIGVGGVVTLVAGGVPFTKWKLGYGEYVTILVVTLAPLLPAFLATIVIAAFGVGCMFADYRSLGAACLAVAAAMLWQRMQSRGSVGKRLLPVIVVAGVAMVAIAALLSFTQDQYSERRQQSNVGRYVGLVIAWRAISESPLIGYGSWAADERFGRMFKAEVDKIDHDSTRFARVRKSLLPHSQFLQAWIEGGILGVAFFLLYGVRIVGAVHWFAMQRKLDPLVPAFLFFLVAGFWNLLASPFLGFMRIYIAIAVAVVAVAASERMFAADSATAKRVNGRGVPA